MKAIVTVIGRDKVGIIAAVSALLAQKQVNILDISQTIMQDFFTMIMLVDTTASTVDFSALQQSLADVGKGFGLTIQIQHEGIFNSMHKV